MPLMNDLGLLAWRGSGGDAVVAVLMLLMVAFYVVLILISLGMQIYFAYIHMAILERVPRPFRKMEPWQAWLIFVPFLNLVWPFLLVIQTPASLRHFAYVKGRPDLGDCGSQMGLLAAIFLMLCFPAGMILMIMYLVKINEVSRALAR